MQVNHIIKVRGSAVIFLDSELKFTTDIVLKTQIKMISSVFFVFFYIYHIKQDLYFDGKCVDILKRS